MAGKDRVVSDAAIVCYVRVDHEQVAVANDGLAVLRHGAMKRDVLANCVAGPDNQPAWTFGKVDVLRLPPEKLDPEPLISGDDLIEHGLPPGKIFKTLLETVRDAQLLERICTKSEALALARRLWEEARGDPKE